jgi:hypothetical protein
MEVLVEAAIKKNVEKITNTIVVNEGPKTLNFGVNMKMTVEKKDGENIAGGMYCITILLPLSRTLRLQNICIVLVLISTECICCQHLENDLISDLELF